MIDTYDEIGDLDEAVDYATPPPAKRSSLRHDDDSGTGFFWLSDLKFLAEWAYCCRC